MKFDVSQKEIKVGDIVVAHNGTKSSNLVVCVIEKMTDKTAILKELNSTNSTWERKHHRKFNQIVKIS